MHGGSAPVHLALKIQDDANWACRGNVALRQAESEVRGKSKEGAKVVVSGAHGPGWATEELELQI